MGQKLLGVVVCIGLAAWMVMRDQKQKGETSEAVLADAQVLMSQMEGYGQDKEYMDSVVSRAHDDAFSVAYKDAKHGRRFRPSEPASFSEDTYVSTLFLQTHRLIQRDIDRLGRNDARKYEDIKRRLEELRQKLQIKD
jgi:hypothetical protein